MGNLLVAPNVPPLHLPGVHQVYSGADARVYSVGGAQPRAVVVSAQQSVPSAAEALNAVTSPQFTPRTVAVTEHPIAGLSQVGSGAGLGSARPAGQALVTSYAPEQVRVRVSAQQPGLLVLDDAYAPGWEATVDGRQVPVRRVDYILRGVRVPAGTHTVTFHYSPLSWRIGWLVSLVSLVALVAALLVGWRRRRAGERRVSFAP